MSGTQGIPDDMKSSDELPADVLGALEMLYRRMCTLDDEMARLVSQQALTRSALLEIWDAVKRLS